MSSEIFRDSVSLAELREVVASLHPNIGGATASYAGLKLYGMIGSAIKLCSSNSNQLKLDAQQDCYILDDLNQLYLNASTFPFLQARKTDHQLHLTCERPEMVG